MDQRKDLANENILGLHYSKVSPSKSRAFPGMGLVGDFADHLDDLLLNSHRTKKSSSRFSRASKRTEELKDLDGSLVNTSLGGKIKMPRQPH